VRARYHRREKGLYLCERGYNPKKIMVQLPHMGIVIRDNNTQVVMHGLLMSDDVG
jgi:hypothetical protein